MIEILCDSINTATGIRVTTFLLSEFPKSFLAQLNTHRVFSRNAASSRAIPVKKTIAKVLNNPFIPTFTRNKKGMQGIDDLSEKEKNEAVKLWKYAIDSAVSYARALADLGIHKQEVNRLLEPFMYVPVIITATEWTNFFNLRCADDVQPDFCAIARLMKHLYERSEPKSLAPGEWHIPLLQLQDKVCLSLLQNLKISAARSARCSLENHLGEFDYEADFELHDRLIEEMHFSPLEHQCKALPSDIRCHNLRSWMSYRAHVEDKLPIRDVVLI